MIKEIDEKDIDECVRVIKQSFNTVAEEFGFSEKNAPGFTAFSITSEKLNLQLKKEHKLMYAFYNNDIIIGYYSLSLKEHNECELNNLCVIPTYRHNGIGEKLLLHSFSIAESLNCKKINIGIVEENKVLKNWYKKFGFIHIGTQKFDFFPFTCGYMEKQI